MMRRAGLIALCACMGLALADDEAKRDPLPVGKLAEGKTAADGPAIYEHKADAAGALTVLLRGKDRTDLALYVTDKDGQVLPDGEVDRGIDGNNGAEQLVCVLPAAGTYLVQVLAPQGGTVEFSLGASWLPAPSLAREADPDGSPSSARSIEPGASLDDDLGPARGDRWDWFAVTAPKAGKLRLTSLAPEGDLRLELFYETKFLAPAGRSDDDLGGVAGHEAIEIDAEAGKRYYLRVLAVDLSAEKLAYKVTAELK